MRLWPTTTENKCFENNNNNVISLKPITICHLEFILKMLWMQYFSKKKKSIQILKMKILWYFIVFLDFFFNIIKLGEPKFTISYSKSILIFSILEVHVLPMLAYIKSGNATTVIWYCALNVFALCKHCSGNSILVRHIAFFFFFFIFSFEHNSSYPFFCLPFVLFFSLLYILFYCTTNFTIFLQLLRCQFLIS